MKTAAALACLLSVAPSWAQDVYVVDRFPTYAPLWKINVASGSMEAAGPMDYWSGLDAATDTSGRLFLGDSTYVLIWVPGATVTPWAPLNDAIDVAALSNGDIVSINSAGGDPMSAVVVFHTDGTLAWEASLPDLHLAGVDVPRAGPLEDAIAALGYDDSGQYWLQAWLSQPDGTFALGSRVGPLDEPDAYTCLLSCPMRPAFARNGQSVYVVRSQEGLIRQYALDGTSMGTFAVIPPDTAALSSGVPGSRYDWVRNIQPLEDGGMVVVTSRRVHVLDASGAITRTIDHVFGYGSAIAPVEWVPFESAGVRCRPWSVGFWKRQCATLGERRRAVGGRGPRGMSPGQPPLHPAMSSIVDLAATIERANRWLEQYGLTACAALQPDAPNTWREKALRRYAAVALNFEYKMLGRRCDVTVDGVQRTVGDVLDEVRTLLGSANEDDLKRAFSLTGDMLGEVSE